MPKLHNSSLPMKQRDQIVFLWDFEKLFHGNPFVWAEINYPGLEIPEAKRKFCLNSLRMSTAPKDPDFYGGAQLILLDIFGNHNTPCHPHGGLRGDNMAKTLQAAGVDKEAFIEHGSATGYWHMERNEQFTDAAIRVARRVFDIMKIHLEGPYAKMLDGRLLSMFVVYRMTWVDTENGCHRFDEHLRQKHGLPAIDEGTLRMSVL